MLVFTHFARWGERLAKHLTKKTKLPIHCYHGGLTRTQRDRMVKEFQEGTGPGALVVSIKAGGTGLNLTAASHVVLYDRWWNPAVEDQARDRAWRIGQAHTVICHRLVCPGTVDERVEEVVAGKRRIADLVLPASSSLGDLTCLGAARRPRAAARRHRRGGRPRPRTTRRRRRCFTEARRRRRKRRRRRQQPQAPRPKGRPSGSAAGLTAGTPGRRAAGPAPLRRSRLLGPAERRPAVRPQGPADDRPGGGGPLAGRPAARPEPGHRRPSPDGHLRGSRPGRHRPGRGQRPPGGRRSLAVLRLSRSAMRGRGTVARGCGTKEGGMAGVGVVVLFTDLVGSTELATGLPVTEAERLRHTHFSLLRNVIATRGGTEVKNLGDGLMVVFDLASTPSPPPSGSSRRLGIHARSGAARLLVRIGISARGGQLRERRLLRRSRGGSGPPVRPGRRRPDPGRRMVRSLAGHRAAHELPAARHHGAQGVPRAAARGGGGLGGSWPPTKATTRSRASPAPRRTARRLLRPEAAPDGPRRRQPSSRLAPGKDAGSSCLAATRAWGRPRLCTEFVRAARVEGAIVLYGRCEEEIGSPFSRSPKRSATTWLTPRPTPSPPMWRPTALTSPP